MDKEEIDQKVENQGRLELKLTKMLEHLRFRRENLENKNLRMGNMLLNTPRLYLIKQVKIAKNNKNKLKILQSKCKVWRSQI